MSVGRRELAAMQSAGWEIHAYGPWARLRALLGRRPVRRAARPVGGWSR
jgi:hypothetical protein